MYLLKYVLLNATNGPLSSRRRLLFKFAELNF